MSYQARVRLFSKSRSYRSPLEVKWERNILSVGTSQLSTGTWWFPIDTVRRPCSTSFRKKSISGPENPYAKKKEIKYSQIRRIYRLGIDFFREKVYACTSSHLRLSCTRRTFRSTAACNACPGYQLVFPTTSFDLSPTTAGTGLTSGSVGLHALCSLLRLIRLYIVGRTGLSSTRFRIEIHND